MLLYSGGLDSILAYRLLEKQGIRVIAIKFITPFFNTEVMDREEEFRQEARGKYGVDLCIREITDDYLLMLKNPAHGYGKNFNPCIDCKILMVRKAMEMMPRHDAWFVATGEVIGQRPMSQRKDTLNCITNESGAEGLLLRPLCAKSLSPTIPEKKGWVKIEEFPHINGRSRKRQMELAKKLGIKDFPAPGGGCILADPIQGNRLKKYFSMWPDMDGNDCRLALAGRQFQLPDGSWLVLGRDRKENQQLASLRRNSDLFLDSMKAPAPSALIRRAGSSTDIRLAASIIMRYGKKCEDVLNLLITGKGHEEILRVTAPTDSDLVRAMALISNQP